MNSSNLLKKILPSGIRSQLIIGIAFIIVLSISLFVADLTNRQKAFFLKLNHDTGIGLSDNLANISTSHVVAFELAGLQKLVGNYKKMPGLEYAMVTTSDGIVLSHTDEKYLGLKATDSISAKLKPTNTTQILLENNSILDVASPIINHNEIVGWARIGLSQTSLTENLREIRERGIVYILISLVISSVLAMLVAGRLTKGLLALITAAKKIKDGDRDLRVAPSTSIELNQLGTAFNQMLDDISSNEKLLSMVLENMPAGVFILDAKGKVLSLNPAAEQIWEGAKYVDMGEYNVYKGWFPDGKEIESHEWGAAVALNENRAVLNQEAEIESFDGNRKTILNSCIPMHDANGNIVGVISINVDITERKRAEDELRKKNHDIGERIKELRCLYRMSQLSIDPHKTIQDIGKECVDLIPSSYQFPDITCVRIELEGELFKSVDFKETIWKQEKEIFSRGVILVKVQVYYKEERPEEVEGPFLAEERLLIDSIADILGSSVERKNSEQELIKSEEKNRALIENISDGIVLLNESREIVYQSSSVERINGYSFEDRKDKSAEALIYGLDRPAFGNFLEKVYNSPGIPLQTQIRMLHKNGRVMWVEGSMINMLHNNSIKGIIVNYRDVTIQKKTTELFKHQFENSPDIILIVDKDLKIESINRGRPDGPSVTELIGMSSIDVLPEESRKTASEAILKCFETGQNQEIENALRSNKWVRSRFVPIVSDGMINHIMVIATDITERKIAEENLKQSEERNRALIENISDTIILLNKKAEVIYQSPAFIHTAGFSMEELNGKTVFDFIHPEDRESSEKLFKEALDSPGVPLPNQYRIKHRQGNYIWVEGTTMNLLNNESVKALIINYRDISERKKFEEQQRLMTSIVNSSEDAIISKSLDGIVTSWNHGAESILGYSAAETIGNPIKMIIPPHLLGEEVEILNRIKRGESIDHFETTRRKKNGDLIYVSLTVSPIFDSTGMVTGASKILRDISDKKQMELEREKTMTELMQRNRDLEQFSYIVSHNLRGPVATILGLSDILQSLSLQQEEKDHLIKGMGSSVQKLDMVIKDLNTILKVRRDLSEKKTLIHFSELVNDIKASLNSLIDKEKVQFSCDFKTTDEITTIKSYLYSIFYNLISNSIKYRQPNAEPLIEIRSEVDGENTILYFKDNGLGIDLQKKGKDVFGLYKRFHLHIEGKGMGLFMVKTQVETLGGKISIKSQENVGTEFKIEFKN